METYIALLRGINVGGHKKIKMADLRSLLTKLGLENVKTYIQSGNVVFTSSESASDCEKRISEGIKKTYGWEVPVLVLTRSEVQQILDDCPFPKEKKENSYFILLYSMPTEEDRAKAKETQFPDEEFALSDSCVYLFTNNYAKGKLSNNWFEKKLKVTATARNFRTLMKLLEMTAD